MLLPSTFAALLLAASSVAHPLVERADFKNTSFAIDQHTSTRELMITLEKTERQGELPRSEASSFIADR